MCHKSSTLHTDIDTQRHTFKRHIPLVYVQRCVVCFKALVWFISLKTVPMTVHPRDEGKQWHRTTAHRTCSCTQWKPASPHLVRVTTLLQCFVVYIFFHMGIKCTRKEEEEMSSEKTVLSHLSTVFVVRFTFTKVSCGRVVLVPFHPRECPFKLTE